MLPQINGLASLLVDSNDGYRTLARLEYESTINTREARVCILASMHTVIRFIIYIYISIIRSRIYR